MNYFARYKSRFAEGIMPRQKYKRAFGRFRSPAYNEDYAH